MGQGGSTVSDRLSVKVLRDLMRQYQAWHSMYESGEVADVLVYGSFSISLWDLDYLVDNLHRLPRRQNEAIRFCFLENLKESDAAVRMGVSPTNPVSMYANEGLKKILAMIEDGSLPRFRYEHQESA